MITHETQRASTESARTSALSGVLRRKCACGDTPGPTGECEQCRKKRLALQRQAASAGPATAPSIVHDVLASPGQPLDASTRTFMEPRFGHSFAGVRVHTDARAAESAAAVGALAYTVGSDVAFGAGRYAPGSEDGRRLLAHELAHVVQQRSDGLATKLEVGPANAPDEREADRASEAVLRGQAASGLSTTDQHLARAVPSKPSKGAGKAESTKPKEGAPSPGMVRFGGCTAAQISRYRILPENGDEMFVPAVHVWYSADGVWDSQRPNLKEWFKIPDHCVSELTCAPGGFVSASACGDVGSAIQDFRGEPRRPEWVTDWHDALQPKVFLEKPNRSFAQPVSTQVSPRFVIPPK